MNDKLNGQYPFISIFDVPINWMVEIKMKQSHEISRWDIFQCLSTHK